MLPYFVSYGFSVFTHLHHRYDFDYPDPFPFHKQYVPQLWEHYELLHEKKKELKNRQYTIDTVHTNSQYEKLFTYYKREDEPCQRPYQPEFNSFIFRESRSYTHQQYLDRPYNVQFIYRQIAQEILRNPLFQASTIEDKVKKAIGYLKFTEINILANLFENRFDQKGPFSKITKGMLIELVPYTIPLEIKVVESDIRDMTKQLQFFYDNHQKNLQTNPRIIKQVLDAQKETKKLSFRQGYRSGLKAPQSERDQYLQGISQPCYYNYSDCGSVQDSSVDYDEHAREEMHYRNLENKHFTELEESVQKHANKRQKLE